jgi:hypothetical protein
MYLYTRQFSSSSLQRAEQPITLRRYQQYSLGEPSTFSPEFRVMKTPVFKTIPVTLETLRGPQRKGGPQILETSNPFADIATLEKLLRQTDVGKPPETLEFSIGQALLAMRVFRPDPANPRNFQVPLLHSLAYPADATNPDKLAPSETPFPIVAITHGQSQSYFFDLVKDSRGNVIKRSVSGSKVPRIEVSKLTAEMNSFLGFEYLQLELAKHGIVSISINSNPANLFDEKALLKFRADLISAHLDHLESNNRNPDSPFFRKLDFHRVGLMGHSRGGDAVVKAFLDNRVRYGINAVVSLAPLDETGLLEPSKRLRLTDPNVHYLVIYGSHDGDVGDWRCGSVDHGTGFRHYDRATCPRSMLFIHGATHNRFNTEWKVDERRVRNEIASGKGGINRILARDEHMDLAKEYIAGWFRMVLKREAELAELFNGTRVVNVTRGPLTVSTQWSFGKRIRVIDDFEGPDASENRLKGKSKATPRAIIKTTIGRISSSFPHQTKVLLAGKIDAASSIFSTEIPNTTQYLGGPRNRDFGLFDLLTFRMTKSFNLGVSQKDIKAQALPRFRVRLKDVLGASSTVDHADIYAANPHAPTRPYHRIDWGEPCKEGGSGRAAVVITVNPLETLSVPLTFFSKANPKIDLSNIRFLEFEFMSVRQDEIFLDDLQLVKS